MMARHQDIHGALRNSTQVSGRFEKEVAVPGREESRGSKIVPAYLDASPRQLGEPRPRKSVPVIFEGHLFLDGCCSGNMLRSFAR